MLPSNYSVKNDIIVGGALLNKTKFTKKNKTEFSQIRRRDVNNTFVLFASLRLMNTKMKKIQRDFCCHSGKEYQIRGGGSTFLGGWFYGG